MSQHTPGPCGCTTEENGFGYTEIAYCPLHAQAPAMREALAFFLSALEGFRRCGLAAREDYSEWTMFERKARAILTAIDT